jgi:hypothetical protein
VVDIGQIFEKISSYKDMDLDWRSGGTNLKQQITSTNSQINTKSQFQNPKPHQ